MWANVSRFDGLRKQVSASNGHKLITANKFAGLQKLVNTYMKTAQRHNDETGVRVEEYHRAFTALYEKSEEVRWQQKQQFSEKLDIIMRECRRHADGSRVLGMVGEFVPAAATANEGITEYILQALAENKPLEQVLPPGFMETLRDAPSENMNDYAC